MFDVEKISTHQRFIAAQKLRKAAIGKGGYAKRKLFEEMDELREELALTLSSGVITDNLINELGDFLFCVLGESDLADQLSDRLQFDVERAERYRLKDLEALK